MCMPLTGMAPLTFIYQELIIIINITGSLMHSNFDFFFRIRRISSSRVAAGFFPRRSLDFRGFDVDGVEARGGELDAGSSADAFVELRPAQS